MIPIDLFSLVVIFEICPFHVKFSSIVIPKKLKDETRSMGVPSIDRVKFGRVDALHCEKWNSMNFF